ncbi:hypothetical protein [Lactococcus formosensis]|uniref:hypothetical protein n=1 Tax=Lactococcus formosensis TaxID=1281486 RepID=UPI002434C3B5|nr:hypothetical protein [Lactococcus formosensis]MDG6113780.1 hypothetical protein [Lactococcus formosensis]MDG6122229.1 hypothetical protein [Lactococcus formosensis]MDG6151835.1 hypothetical protein [Lactococcus formosensis]MDG6174945.1 hypothetical protein [Lactococcus formosensis]MDG6181263.1 hypothetical protein [Lactococcus formosensis]
MNKTIDKFIQARNEVNATINSLVSEVLEDFDTYEEAIHAINKVKWDMTGSLGHYVIEEAGRRIKDEALKRVIKEKTPQFRLSDEPKSSVIKVGELKGVSVEE